MPPIDSLDEPASSDAALDRLLRRDRRAEVTDRLRHGWDSMRARAGWLGAAAAVVAAAVVVWALIGGRGDPPELTLPTASPSTAPDAPGAASSRAMSPSTASPGEVVVHVTGAVVHAGLLHLPIGARVADALDAAGGPAADADVDRLNLAQPLTDGSRLAVPRLGEDLPPPAVSATPPTGAGSAGAGPADATPEAPVDLNTADVAELERLPGIGPSTAQAIVDHRDANGPFRSVDDLLDVRGIGPAKLEALRAVATVGG
jgi:competence protein ComEA